MLNQRITHALETIAYKIHRIRIAECEAAAPLGALKDVRSRALRLFGEAEARHTERDDRAPLRHIVGR